MRMGNQCLTITTTTSNSYSWNVRYYRKTIHSYDLTQILLVLLAEASESA